jgi:alkylhydroperoxidase/carboxymuconolactone decarboxylase family protein YurZ
MNGEWESRRDSFEIIDVKKLTGNFLPMILKKSEKVAVGDGICVLQTFEPVPLYSALADLGFEHVTEKISDDEYRAYFYRKEKKVATTPAGMDIPLKPAAIVNFKTIDHALADIAVNFWKLIWDRENPAIDQKTKYMISLANGVGAQRFRQATRELVKAYSVGLTLAELDELFSMFVWNQGIGSFASEISPSPLFGAYQLIKKLEGQGKSRTEVMKELIEKFGEKNPQVGTFYESKK